MATANVACIGQYQACALRAARLSADCTPLASANNIVTTAGLVTMTATPDVEEGTKYEPKNGCGSIPWTAEGEDIIKRWNLDIQLILWDFELIEILTGAALIIGDSGTTWPSKNIGFESRGPNADVFAGASLEIWSRNSKSGGPCGPVGENPPYTRHIFPRTKLRLAERTFADEAAVLRLQGWSGPNSEWGEGPVSDEWEGADPLSSDTPYASIFATELPTTGCGYVTAT